MMPSTTACCNKDIFAVARGMTIFEMVLTYLSLLLGVANVKDGQPRAESSVNQLLSLKTNFSNLSLSIGLYQKLILLLPNQNA